MGALYDFALHLAGPINSEKLIRLVQALRDEYGSEKGLVEATLCGTSKSSEALAIFRFSFSAYSAGLRERMQREASALGAKLLDPQLLSEHGRKQHDSRVNACDVRAQLLPDAALGISSFQARAGGGAQTGAGPSLQLSFGSADELWTAYSRSLAEGNLFIATSRKFAEDSRVRMVVLVPGEDPLEATGHVIAPSSHQGSPGYLVTLQADERFKNFLDRHAQKKRAGRRLTTADRRDETRVEARLKVTFRDYPELSSEWTSNISKGGMFIEIDRPLPLRARVNVSLTLPQGEELEILAEVVHVNDPNRAKETGLKAGVGVSFLPESADVCERLGQFVKEHPPKQDVKPTGQHRRQHPRYETCLEVQFRSHPELSAKFATNISSGGLFVPTLTPPSRGSKVQLKVKLPDGEEVETPAEVAHVVSADEAKERGIVAGVGLSFVQTAPEFREPIERLIGEYKARRPRVLAIDDDAFFRKILFDQLTAAGMDIEVCASGTEGFNRMLEVFNELDLLIIDLNMPDMDGRDLLYRIRRVGGESDLRVVIMSSSAEEELQQFVGPTGANAAIQKNSGLPAMLERIKQVLGR